MVFVIILLGMVVFAGLHTLSASQSFKKNIQDRVGDRVYHGFYRLAYNIFALISFAPITLAIGLHTKVVWWLPESHPILAIVVTIIGLMGSIGFLISLVQIDLLRFAGIKQVWVYFKGGELPLPPEPVQLKGMYRYVRHPLYFFSLLSMWFVPLMIESQLVFTVAATAYLLIGSRWEEQRMVKAFGQEYVTYQQNVPWLIPFVKFR